MRRTAAVILVTFCLIPPAIARHHKHRATGGTISCNDRGCNDASTTHHVESAVRAVGHRINGLVPPLAAKIAEIQAACGSAVISTLRHTLVAGSGRPSLHNVGQAADVRGNPSCIYSHLSGWPGGYSVDYGRVRHVHISYSYGGREWGARFQHYHGGRHRHHHRRHR